MGQLNEENEQRKLRPAICGRGRPSIRLEYEAEN